MRAALNVLVMAMLVLPAAGGPGRLPSGIPQASEDPLTAEQYWGRVEETRQAVADLDHQAEGMARSRLDQLADGWERVVRVTMPDGVLVKLDHSELVALLRQNPPELSGLLARLDALLALHKRFPSSLFTLEDVESLESVLAGPSFQWKESKPSPLAEWWARLLERIAEWFARLLGKTGVAGATLPTGPIFTGVLAIVLVLVLVFAGRGLFAGLVKDVELGGDGPGGHEALTSETALQRAGSLSQGGNYRSAVRYLYLSALLLLDERGLLRYDRSRTNREYLRSVSASPALVSPLRAVIEIFDRVWYGFESIDAQTYQEYVKRVDELRKQKS